MKRILLCLLLIMAFSTNVFAATIFDSAIEPDWQEVKKNSTKISFVDSCPQHIKATDLNSAIFMVSNANLEIGLITVETWEVKLENNEYYGQQHMEINKDLKTKKTLNGNFIASPWKKLDYNDPIYKSLEFLVEKNLVKLTNASPKKDSWNYLGMFVLRRSINPVTDLFILNHLTPFTGKQHGDYLYYDVYYQHDHSTDEGTGKKEYSDWAFDFKGKVVMLDSDGTPIKNQGIYSGEIITDICIRTKGSFGVAVKSFKVCEPKTGKILFNGNAEPHSGEGMYMNTAASYMLNVSAPHPVAPISLRGYGEYPYK